MKTTRTGSAAMLALALGGCGAGQPSAAPQTADAADAPVEAATDAGALAVQTYTSSGTGEIDIEVNSHLVFGPTEALLVDGQLLAADAQNVVGMIRSSGRTLKSVWLTHAHPDHYAGFAVIKAAFPQAQFFTTPAVLGDFQASAPGTFSYLQSVLGSLVAGTLVTPAVLPGDGIDVDGQTVRVVELPNAGESKHAAALALPGGVLVSGDLLYDDVHLFLGECGSAGWMQNLAAVQAMGFTSFYPGHGKAPVDAGIFAADQQYITGAVPILRAAEAGDAGAGDGGDPRVGQAVHAIAQQFPAFASQYLLGYSTTTFIDTNKCP